MGSAINCCKRNATIKDITNIDISKIRSQNQTSIYKNQRRAGYIQAQNTQRNPHHKTDENHNESSEEIQTMGSGKWYRMATSQVSSLQHPQPHHT